MTGPAAHALRNGARRPGAHLLMLLLVAVLALAGCSGAADGAGDDAADDADDGSSSASTAAEGGGEGTEAGADDGSDMADADDTLVIASSFPISTVDPTVEGYWAQGFGFGELLLRQTPDGVPEPWVAASAESVGDTEWELAIHEGVTFQNGNPVDADAVVAVLQAHVAASETLASALPDATFEATGDLTVSVTTSEPAANLPALLANEIVPVYDVAAREALGEDPDEQALIDAGLYTGPYQVVSLDASEMVMARNEGYWQGTPPLEQVTLAFIADDQSRILAVRSGEVDVAMYAPTAAAAELEGAEDAIFTRAAAGTLGPRATIQVEEPPTDDPLVRQAISLAIDYESIATDVLDGVADVATSMYPAGSAFAVENQVHDPHEAAARLEEAGWAMGDDGVRTKDGDPLAVEIVAYQADPDMLPVATAMAAQLAEVGFDASIREVDSSSALYSEDLTGWHIGLFRTGFFGYGDILGLAQDLLGTDGAFNAGHIDDPEVNEILAELNQTFDIEERDELLAELQELVVTDQAYAFMVASRPIAMVVSPEWAGYEPSQFYINVDWQTAP